MTICPVNDSCDLGDCMSESIKVVGRSQIGNTCVQCGHVFRCDGEVAGGLTEPELPLPTCSIECALAYTRGAATDALNEKEKDHVPFSSTHPQTRPDASRRS